MGNYIFLRLLGKGSFGEVWLANEPGNENLVAIKFLKNLESDALDRFRREIRILTEHIDNRFIVNVLSFNLSGADPYFVMEYCEGGSLREQVGKLNWRNSAFALSHVIQALTSIHQNGGYHRDIKPDNILLAKDGTNKELICKLSDFGLGRTPDPASSVMTHSPGGTRGYIAPEVVLGGKYTPAADVYSLGVTIIELLTGKLQNQMPSSPQIPVSFINLLNQMTKRNPTERPGLRVISQVIFNLLRLDNIPSVQPAAAAAHSIMQKLGGADWLAIGGAALALLGLLAGGDDKKWDDDVGRYRGEDGRFKRG